MPLLKCLLQRGGVDARSLAEIKRRHAQKWSFLGYKFAGANLLLLGGTTPVLGRSDTLSIYSYEGLIPRRLRRGCWFGTIFGWLWSRNFELNYEENLIRLYEDLKNRKWQPGKSQCFIVTKPVRREIFAAPFRDRIVHHILIGRLNTAFEKYFIRDSYACRVGKGTHAAIRKVEHNIKSESNNGHKETYILKLDIKGFFMKTAMPCKRKFIPWDYGSL